MNITAISDFSSQGSGYASICGPLFTELALLGHNLTVLGIAYEGGQHNFPYRIIPVARREFIQQVEAMVANLALVKTYTDALIVAMDITIQEAFLPRLAVHNIPYYGLFPIEAPELSKRWANVLGKMAFRFVMSQYGVRECEKHNLQASYLPIAVDTDSWRPPVPEEKQMLRAAMGIGPDDKVIITIADNQERKNLSAAFQAVERLCTQHENIYYVLVTRTDSQVGWMLDDLRERHHLMDNTMIFKRGMPFKRLWTLGAMADVALFTSKAEGVCMPALEAMSMGIPVVAPRHTSFGEHLADGRGLMCDIAFVDEGPFGNEYRYYVDVESVTEQLEQALFKPLDGLVPSAREYVVARTHKKVADVIAPHLS